MKTNPVLFAFLASGIVLLAALAGCEGPAGPAGQNGQSVPAFGLEGFAPGIQCASCHSADSDTTYHVAGREAQWALSTHAIGGNVIRNNATCAGCHTTEGFLQRMNGQAVTDQPVPTPPGCFTCHSPHARGNFTLRDTVPVTLLSNVAGVADAQFNYGKGNMCVQCHQPRTLATKMDGTRDTIVITTNRWYSHYGVQGQMLMGEGGYKFPNATYTGNSVHSSIAGIQQEGCPICHMAERVGVPQAGGHTMNIFYAGTGGTETPLLDGCNQTGCHTSPAMTASTVAATQSQIDDSLRALRLMLAARGWLDTTSTEDLVKLTGGRLVVTPGVKAGALFNYFFVAHDLSKGIHNTRFASELLSTSLAALRTP